MTTDVDRSEPTDDTICAPARSLLTVTRSGRTAADPRPSAPSRVVVEPDASVTAIQALTVRSCAAWPVPAWDAAAAVLPDAASLGAESAPRTPAAAILARPEADAGWNAVAASDAAAAPRALRSASASAARAARAAPRTVARAALVALPALVLTTAVRPNDRMLAADADALTDETASRLVERTPPADEDVFREAEAARLVARGAAAAEAPLTAGAARRLVARAAAALDSDACPITVLRAVERTTTVVLVTFRAWPNSSSIRLSSSRIATGARTG